ncbi:MAG: hypothetical protein WBD20_12850 [Pirellulaceae bacterium]
MAKAFVTLKNYSVRNNKTNAEAVAKKAADTDELLPPARRQKLPDASTSQRLEYLCQDSQNRLPEPTTIFDLPPTCPASPCCCVNASMLAMRRMSPAKKRLPKRSARKHTGYRSELVDLNRAVKSLKKTNPRVDSKTAEPKSYSP